MAEFFLVCIRKMPSRDFPDTELLAAGYYSVFAGQKTYNGVAILSREQASDVRMGIPGYEDEQKRGITATFSDVRVVCVYIPNGQSPDSDKYQYKLGWLAALHDWLKEELVRYPKLVLLGDYNIAPEDHDPAACVGNVLVNEPERAAFRGLEALGLKDSYRLFDQQEKTFSWWGYQMMAFRRNMGMRIDHILISEPLVAECKSCVIDKTPRKLERPSDHTPVVVEL